MSQITNSRRMKYIAIGILSYIVYANLPKDWKFWANKESKPNNPEEEDQ